MKVPYLKFWDKTPVIVTITDGIDGNGAPKVIATYEGKCNYNEKTKTVRSADGQFIQLSGVLTIGADIAPGVPAIAGKVLIDGLERKIHSGSRPRNPDGTVNHTKLELV